MKREFESKYTAQEIEELLDKVKEIHSSAINHIETLPAYPYSINTLISTGIYSIDSVKNDELPEYFLGKEISPIEVYVTSTFEYDEYAAKLTQYIRHGQHVWFRNKPGDSETWEPWEELMMIPPNFIKLFDIGGVIPMMDGNKVGVIIDGKGETVQNSFQHLVHLLTGVINADSKKLYIKGHVYSLTQIIELIIGDEFPTYYYPVRGDIVYLKTSGGFGKIRSSSDKKHVYLTRWKDPSDVTSDDLPPFNDAPKPNIPDCPCGPMVPPPCRYDEHAHTATERPFCEVANQMHQHYCQCYHPIKSNDERRQDNGGFR